MNTDCLQHALTEKERAEFEQNGFLIVEDVLPEEMIKALTVASDRLDAAERALKGRDPFGSQNIFDFVGKDDAYVELLDWPKTFPKVWGILGWNIQLYHSHLIVTPPQPAGLESPKKRLGWHQDSDRLNKELKVTPQPRLSLKVAFFLTDTTKVGCANMYVVPGSQVKEKIDFPADPTADPDAGVSVRAPRGSAVFFDRRIWHASSPNYLDFPRKVLFYGYSYRWLRPRDNMTVDHYAYRSDPIRQQLMGMSHSGNHGYSSPQEMDVPLRNWLRQHVGEAAAA
jgi:ectoine hydroxylase-related dioxygenase (phytanoyl-CoA dioxygenase family)